MANSDTSTTSEVLVTFEIKARPGANVEEALALQQGLKEMAGSTPSIGEIGASNWTNEDGTFLVMYTFKSMDAVKEFVRHPLHIEAMKRGKEFFSSLKTQIAPIQKQSINNFGG